MPLGSKPRQILLEHGHRATVRYIEDLEAKVERLEDYIRSQCSCLSPGYPCGSCYVLGAARGDNDAD